MSDGFSVFYDTKAEIFKGIGEYDNKFEAKKTIYGDFQPLSGKLEDCEYGFRAVSSASLYCTDTDAWEIGIGDYAQVDGKRYRVEHVERRKLGAKILLKEMLA